MSFAIGNHAESMGFCQRCAGNHETSRCDRPVKNVFNEAIAIPAEVARLRTDTGVVYNTVKTKKQREEEATVEVPRFEQEDAAIGIGHVRKVKNERQDFQKAAALFEANKRLNPIRKEADDERAQELRHAKKARLQAWGQLPGSKDKAKPRVVIKSTSDGTVKRPACADAAQPEGAPSAAVLEFTHEKEHRIAPSTEEAGNSSDGEVAPALGLLAGYESGDSSND